LLDAAVMHDLNVAAPSATSAMSVHRTGTN
jgi:hypothetical protein